MQTKETGGVWQVLVVCVGVRLNKGAVLTEFPSKTDTPVFGTGSHCVALAGLGPVRPGWP